MFGLQSPKKGALMAAATATTKKVAPKPTPPKKVAAGPKPPKPKASSEWTLVTPTMAHAWLGKNMDNRKIRRMRVASYTHDIKNDQWITTHQGVAFDWDGNLRDGQHRLVAIIEADRPLWMLVTHDLDPLSQRHMDRGASRLVSDFIGGVNGAARASAARYLISLRTLEGVATPAALYRAARAVTDADIYDFFENEPGLAEDMEEISVPAGRAARVLEGMGPSPLIVAATTFPKVGSDSLNYLHSGAGIEVGSPLLALRNYRGPGLSSTHIGVHTALRVFQAVDLGKSFTKLQVQGVEGAVKVKPR